MIYHYSKDMAYINNNDKMLRAVLMNERLKEFGKYDYSEVNTIYQALDSDNYVINAVAQIIKRTGEGASERELWKEINEYLKRNV
jgi:hypothetical protein